MVLFFPCIEFRYSMVVGRRSPNDLGMGLVRAHPGMGLAPVIFVLAVHPGGYVDRCNKFRIMQLLAGDVILQANGRSSILGIEDVMDNAKVLDLRIWRPGQYLQALPPYGAF